MITTLKRIISSGLKTFWRNGFLSSSSILTLTITLVIAGIFYLSIIISQSILLKVQDKVDINIYFVSDAPVEKVLDFQKEIYKLAEVDQKKSFLLTKKEALEDFKKTEVNNKMIEEVIGVVGKNPLGDVLNIKSTNIDSYPDIITFLESNEMAKFAQIIEMTNYNENKFTIDRIKIWIKYTKIIGAMVLSIFLLISLILIYNTIRLIIYSYREEIQVMKLIGASNFYARSPFLIEAMLFGVISGIFAGFIIWILIYYSADLLKQLVSINLNQYFSDNIIKIFGSLILSGVVISFISTYISVAKYLKIKNND